jgi:hypothetical protein
MEDWTTYNQILFLIVRLIHTLFEINHSFIRFEISAGIKSSAKDRQPINYSSQV